MPTNEEKRSNTDFNTHDEEKELAKKAERIRKKNKELAGKQRAAEEQFHENDVRKGNKKISRDKEDKETSAPARSNRTKTAADSIKRDK